MDMEFDVKVWSGAPAVRSYIGSVSGSVSADNYGTEYLVLDPGESIAFSKGYTSFCIGTDQPLLVDAVDISGLAHFKVSKVFLTDNPYNVIVLHSISAEKANINVFYTLVGDDVTTGNQP